MKKYISLEIPTKKYIKAFLISQYGEKVILTKRTSIGSKFYDLLIHGQIMEDIPEKGFSYFYDSKVKIYFSLSTFNHRGGTLTFSSIKAFNFLLEEEIKRRLRIYMDIYIELNPSFVKNLPYIREKLGIDLDAWDADSMKKDYYRYRLKTGKPLLYKK